MADTSAIQFKPITVFADRINVLYGVKTHASVSKIKQLLQEYREEGLQAFSIPDTSRASTDAKRINQDSDQYQAMVVERAAMIAYMIECELNPILDRTHLSFSKSFAQMKEQLTSLQAGDKFQSFVRNAYYKVANFFDAILGDEGYVRRGLTSNIKFLFGLIAISPQLLKRQGVEIRNISKETLKTSILNGLKLAGEIAKYEQSVFTDSNLLTKMWHSSPDQMTPEYFELIHCDDAYNFTVNQAYISAMEQKASDAQARFADFRERGLSVPKITSAPCAAKFAKASDGTAIISKTWNFIVAVLDDTKFFDKALGFFGNQKASSPLEPEAPLLA
ncbi:MAG: hypothetical protein HOA17_01435 [Candidatus Melainabacteria bacterium]|jgi:hypothetical protein|nr:hypothetical protein [Candidatus Melainabacteria bacterium]